MSLGGIRSGQTTLSCAVGPTCGPRLERPTRPTLSLGWQKANDKDTATRKRAIFPLGLKVTECGSRLDTKRITSHQHLHHQPVPTVCLPLDPDVLRSSRPTGARLEFLHRFLPSHMTGSSKIAIFKLGPEHEKQMSLRYQQTSTKIDGSGL